MATAGTLVGGQVFLQADIDNNSTFVTVACTTDVGLDLSNEVIEKLCHSESSGGVDYVGGLVKWSVSLSGLFALDSVLGAIDLIALVKAGTKFKVRVQMGGTTGDKYEEGFVIVENISLQGPNKGSLVTYSATLRGCQVPTSSTVA